MQYDNTYRNLETLRKIKIPGHDDWEVDLVHVVTSSAVRGWIASREFLNYRVKLTLPDKRVVLAAKSVDELKDTPLKVFSGRATTISILNVSQMWLKLRTILLALFVNQLRMEKPHA